MFGSSGSLAVAPALYSSLGIDPRKAFVPIATVALLPHVFVVNLDVPAKTIAEFVAYAKANPGKINFGAGLGTPPHLLSTLFKTEAHIDVVYIPYNGSAQSVTDLLGGRTQFTIDGLVTLYPLIKAGKVRPLAIARGERWPALPDVPTLVESGYPDFVLDAWTGVVAPAGTPTPIVDKLNAAINTALKTPAAQASLAKFSAIAKTGTPDDFRNFLADQTQRWGAIVKLANAKIELSSCRRRVAYYWVSLSRQSLCLTVACVEPITPAARCVAVERAAGLRQLVVKDVHQSSRRGIDAL